MSQELQLPLRPRNDASLSSNGTPAAAAAAAAPAAPSNTNSPPPVPVTHPVKKWFDRLTAAVHVAACMVLIVGFILRADFHSGQECEMTYSMRHFVELNIDNDNGPPHAVYRLYKFTDRRDPRQQHLYSRSTLRGQRGRDNNNNDWCTTTTTTTTPQNASTTAIVLYIPGHWGSYTQARSLGAHGLQWTRQYYDSHQLVHQQEQFLQNGTWNGQSTNLSSFVYDVYAIDFCEQGGALHANFLRAQTDYVATVITTLMRTCNTTKITLVGHSMGGLVARSIPMFHPSRQKISNLITLATPHERLPYGFDETLHDFYKLLDSHEEQATLVSISGGLRDEMIPPSVCHARNNTNTYSVRTCTCIPKSSLVLYLLEYIRIPH
jgi:hypothetical protein